MIPLTARAVREWAALSAALATATPACDDDPRFITEQEDLPAGTDAELADICTSCSAFDLCDAFARLARPVGGLWAGRRYRERSRPRSDAHTDVWHAAGTRGV